MSTKANASGLEPTASKALSDRDPTSEEVKLIKGLKELYSCKPTSSSYSIYAADAVFHDPIGLAKGVDSIRAQFDGLAKIFPKAEIPKFRVLKNPGTLQESTLLIDQDVAYYRDASAQKPTKTVNSLLTVTRDPSTGLIKSHIEEWDHKKETTSEDGFLGQLNEWRKSATASVVDTFVGTKSKA